MRRLQLDCCWSLLIENERGAVPVDEEVKLVGPITCCAQ